MRAIVSSAELQLPQKAMILPPLQLFILRTRTTISQIEKRMPNKQYLKFLQFLQIQFHQKIIN